MDDELLERWKRDVLLPKAKLLGEVQQELTTAEKLPAFKRIVEFLFGSARDAFMRMAGIAAVDDFIQQEELCLIATQHIVSALNNELPLDHPYIIVLLGVGDAPVRIALLSRKAIPGMHDNLHANLVPVIVVPTLEALRDPNKLHIQFLNRKDDEFDRNPSA